MTQPPDLGSAVRFTGIDAAPYAHLFGMSNADLADRGARRYVADAKPGYPCRNTLRDAEVGEPVLLVNHVHLTGTGPYRASHAVFIREGDAGRAEVAGAVPDFLRSRLLSVRAFDAQELMTEAAVVPGRELEGVIESLFRDPAHRYLHLHSAARGCYFCRVDRLA